MTHRLVSLIAFSLFAWSPGASGAPAPGEDIERRAQALEKLLTAPCCYKGTLEDHSSPVASEMREEIRAFLREGKTRGQILDHYRAKYGQAVLVEPPRGGLSKLVLYGLPFGLAVLGLVVMTAFMARRKGDIGEMPHHGEASPWPLPPEMEARIDALVSSEGPQSP